MAAWEVPLGIVLTIFGGIALALQAGVNASLGIHITKPVASIVSFGLGLAACCVYLLIDATAVSKQLPSLADVQGAPWWAWIGGVLGAYYVIINITFAYKLGAGTAVAVFVCSQLGMSIILDLTGLVGFQKRAFSWQRITGVALMVMGVILVTQFPGDPILPPKQPLEAAEAQQQQQQQGRVKEPKQPSLQEQLQAASGVSLLPTASVGGSGSSSSSSLSGSSGSMGSLELATANGNGSSSSSMGSGAGSSSRGLRGLSGVVPLAQHPQQQQQQQQQQLHHRHTHQHQQTADVEIKVVDTQ